MDNDYNHTFSFIPTKDENQGKKPYIYAIVRKDIPVEQALVQIGHAAWHAGQSFPDTDIIPSFITLEVENEKELLEAAERLKRYHIEHAIFYEPDFGPMGYSAICTRAVFSSKERKIMWKWSTYKATTAVSI